MGILSASTSFTRYRIAEDVPDTLWPEVVARLKAHRFQEIEDTAEERSFGWVSFDEMLDADFSQSPPEKGEYITFALRLDTRRIQAAVKKKHTRLALEEYKRNIEEQGRKGITREERDEILEQVRLKLLTRTLPVPAVFDVVWNTAASRIYLGSTRDKIQEMFEEIFYHTFGLQLIPLHPYFLAQENLDSKRREHLDSLEPTLFI
ncbi:MAG: recombination-associated protein RdgC [Desulfovibrionales bacterium]